MLHKGMKVINWTVFSSDHKVYKVIGPTADAPIAESVTIKMAL